MNILILSHGADTAGRGAALARAFSKHTDWTVRSVSRSKSYMRYPTDLMYDEDTVRSLFAAADVVQHNQQIVFPAGVTPGPGKPIVLMHQGSRLRDNPAGNQAAGCGAAQLVSTVDLLADAPGATWAPAPFDLEWLATKYGGRARGSFKVAHAPTNRAIKSTELVIETCRNLGVELDVIEGLRWTACLSRKGLAHLMVDQLKLGFGCNAIEAWAMNIPVIAGWEDPEDRAAFMRETGLGEDELPMYEATEATLEETIGEMAASPTLRREYGERGRAYVERFHSEEAVVARLKPFYEALVEEDDFSEQSDAIETWAMSATETEERE